MDVLYGLAEFLLVVRGKLPSGDEPRIILWMSIGPELLRVELDQLRDRRTAPENRTCHENFAAHKSSLLMALSINPAVENIG
jgi:hypothetical protein